MRKKADICGHLRTNSDSAKNIVRIFASRSLKYRLILSKKAKNGFMKMALPDGSTDD